LEQLRDFWNKWHFWCKALQGRENIVYFLSLNWRRGGQASSEDLFPLGYGEWERMKVRVKQLDSSLRSE
jgi:hypothetical protein